MGQNTSSTPTIWGGNTFVGGDFAYRKPVHIYL